jgi:hypothetical protein
MNISNPSNSSKAASEVGDTYFAIALSKTAPSNVLAMMPMVHVQMMHDFLDSQSDAKITSEGASNTGLSFDTLAGALLGHTYFETFQALLARIKTAALNVAYTHHIHKDPAKQDQMATAYVVLMQVVSRGIVGHAVLCKLNHSQLSLVLAGVFNLIRSDLAHKQSVVRSFLSGKNG